jgi:hypothetical protein
MRTFAVFGIIAVILTLVSLIALLAAGTATDMEPRTRLMLLSGSLAGMGLFATLTALLLRRASA